MTVSTDLKVYQNLINGELRGAIGDEKIGSIDPSTGRVWAYIPQSTEEDAVLAVNAAKSAFPAWKKAKAEDRAAALRKVAELIGEHGDALAALETQDTGWVIRETTYGLIPVLQQIWFNAAAGALGANRGQTVPVTATSLGYTLREPYGVVVGITPWNAPLFTLSIKAANAMAAGNTVIIKPSEHASSASLYFAELVKDIFPPGVFNVISGYGADIGDALTSHPDVNKISLTGSSRTAATIARATADKPKPLILELGGKSANIIFQDADIDAVADAISTYSIFSGNSGQICVGSSRLLVHRSIFDKVAKAVVLRLKNPAYKTYGPTLDPTTTTGPIANKSQYDIVRNYIQVGLDEGAELLFGGRSGGAEVAPGHSDLAEGYWIEPTLLKAESNTLRICQEEIFGPVAVMIPFDTEEQALSLANGTEFGLAAGVWTKDLSLAHRMVSAIEAGNVWVNTYARVGPEMPFSGVKSSGFGTDSIEDYCREKSCVIEL
ncbi:aldehyde dehydrogenase family protein [Planococcus sp. S3-L1]|uniref:aldehyde dehydrogenase family protein n=1 Tax=Planococcus sp. S3-L1 TaxID=3046200 RepID=UPI0024BA6B1B|nr:aldehyde dehydrogenase family protein [Planococcus sp. S3-L1]MDJ0331564.1 aldehyde dehydrogenase family protein [Planococcus sp. S3-L1]